MSPSGDPVIGLSDFDVELTSFRVQMVHRIGLPVLSMTSPDDTFLIDGRWSCFRCTDGPDETV